jgi:hypothetical protein
MGGLVPVIPMIEAPCLANRDRRHKPGDDVHEWFDLIGRCSTDFFDRNDASKFASTP